MKKKLDVKGAIKMLKIARRNFDTPTRNLAIAVALECLGVKVRWSEKRSSKR